MRIAVTNVGDELEALIDPRFGRAQSLLLVDADTMEFETAANRCTS